jgi:hypothetical protein
VDPLAFRTICACPLIEPPVPAAKGVNAPRVAVADSADATAVAMAAPASPIPHAAASHRVLNFECCAITCPFRVLVGPGARSSWFDPTTGSWVQTGETGFRVTRPLDR